MDAQIKGEEQTHTLCRAEKAFVFWAMDDAMQCKTPKAHTHHDTTHQTN